MTDDSRSSPEVLGALLDVNASRRPGAEAITDGTRRLTWAEYHERAGALAGALRGAGVRQGDRVAVHLPKSVDSFVAVHAIVRLGAVVVPVDWFAPPAYAGAVLADSGAVAVISSADAGQLRAMVAADSPLAVVRPDADAAPVSVAATLPSDPAYIVYTSGSTGRPKGIVHSHASALAYARRAVATYGIDDSDRLVNIAPLHFDQSTFELWAAPLAGAAVVVVSDAVLRFPASVSDLVAGERGTVWYSVPFAITQLVTRGAVDQRDLSALRWVLFGGETFPSASLAEAMAALAPARFSNVYGPAEVNQCTFHHLAAPPPTGAPVPIGRPWDGTELMLVDRADRRIDGPADGELLVSTDTMMTGYWDRPDLTAAAVVTHRDGGNRTWYRTGDVCRRLGDGSYVFLGRRDNQVKLRGHRIEVEAVESVIAAEPGVDVCAVVVERDGSDERLVAVVSPPPDEHLRAALLTRLRTQLPRYAVPNEILGLADLPRTGTGKVDRGAVRDVLRERPGDFELASAPTSKLD